ncbi:hypothetical protein PR048_028881 [Dryococelus australis]|uniref:Uncharacterized protein n=1 Tax=Dryococelus australis TaxID=614101 RepID=A0ABQ9GBT5_9NEOP|nr:hypothetical protein PR048_028881 [Dryococelus australis]
MDTRSLLDCVYCSQLTEHFQTPYLRHTFLVTADREVSEHVGPTNQSRHKDRFQSHTQPIRERARLRQGTARSSPSTVTADNQCAADIGIFVHTSVQSSLQVIELAKSPGTNDVWKLKSSNHDTGSELTAQPRHFRHKYDLLPIVIVVLALMWRGQTVVGSSQIPDATHQSVTTWLETHFWPCYALSSCDRLVHTVFDTSCTRLAQSSPCTVTGDNQCVVDIGIFVHKTGEYRLQVIELPIPVATAAHVALRHSERVVLAVCRAESCLALRRGESGRFAKLDGWLALCRKPPPLLPPSASGTGADRSIHQTGALARLAAWLSFPFPTWANRVRLPQGSLPDFRLWESCRCDAAGRRVFPGDLPFPPPFHYGAAMCSPRLTLAGSQDAQISSLTKTRWKYINEHMKTKTAKTKQCTHYAAFYMTREERATKVSRLECCNFIRPSKFKARQGFDRRNDGRDGFVVNPAVDGRFCPHRLPHVMQSSPRVGVASRRSTHARPQAATPRRGCNHGNGEFYVAGVLITTGVVVAHRPARAERGRGHETGVISGPRWELGHKRESSPPLSQGNHASSITKRLGRLPSSPCQPSDVSRGQAVRGTGVANLVSYSPVLAISEGLMTQVSYLQQVANCLRIRRVGVINGIESPWDEIASSPHKFHRTFNCPLGDHSISPRAYRLPLSTATLPRPRRRRHGAYAVQVLQRQMTTTLQEYHKKKYASGVGTGSVCVSGLTTIRLQGEESCKDACTASKGDWTGMATNVAMSRNRYRTQDGPCSICEIKNEAIAVTNAVARFCGATCADAVARFCGATCADAVARFCGATCAASEDFRVKGGRGHATTLLSKQTDRYKAGRPSRRYCIFLAELRIAPFSVLSVAAGNVPPPPQQHSPPCSGHVLVTEQRDETATDHGCRRQVWPLDYLTMELTPLLTDLVRAVAADRCKRTSVVSIAACNPDAVCCALNLPVTLVYRNLSVSHHVNVRLTFSVTLHCRLRRDVRTRFACRATLTTWAELRPEQTPSNSNGENESLPKIPEGRGRGGVVVRLPASHLGKSGFDSRRSHSQIFACAKWSGDAAGRRVFSRISRFRPLYSGAAPHSPNSTLIRATRTRTRGALSLLRARRAVFPSWSCTVQIRSVTPPTAKSKWVKFPARRDVSGGQGSACAAPPFLRGHKRANQGTPHTPTSPANPIWLDSTVVCTLEPQMFVHWLIPQRVASVAPHLAVWHSPLVNLHEWGCTAGHGVQEEKRKRREREREREERERERKPRRGTMKQDEHVRFDRETPTSNQRLFSETPDTSTIVYKARFTINGKVSMPFRIYVPPSITLPTGWQLRNLNRKPHVKSGEWMRWGNYVGAKLREYADGVKMEYHEKTQPSSATSTTFT